MQRIRCRCLRVDRLVGHRLALGMLQAVLHLLQTILGDPKMLHQPVINHLFIFPVNYQSQQICMVHCLAVTTVVLLVAGLPLLMMIHNIIECDALQLTMISRGEKQQKQ